MYWDRVIVLFALHLGVEFSKKVRYDMMCLRVWLFGISQALAPWCCKLGTDVARLRACLDTETTLIARLEWPGREYTICSDVKETACDS